jgi:hypothetical protein
MFSYCSIFDSRYEFSLVFNLLEVSVRDLYGFKIGWLYCLIVSHRFDYGDINSQTSLMLFFIFSFISYMLMGYHRLIISVIFLNRDVFNSNYSLWTWLGVDDLDSIWGLNHWLPVFYWAFQHLGGRLIHTLCIKSVRLHSLLHDFSDNLLL